MLPQTCGGHNRRPTIVRFGTAHAVTSVFSGRASIARRRRRKGLTALTCPAQRRDGEDLLEPVPSGCIRIAEEEKPVKHRVACTAGC